MKSFDHTAFLLNKIDPFLERVLVVLLRSFVVLFMMAVSLLSLLFAVAVTCLVFAVMMLRMAVVMVGTRRTTQAAFAFALAQ
jgi:hypothetical protein